MEDRLDESAIEGRTGVQRRDEDAGIVGDWTEAGIAFGACIEFGAAEGEVVDAVELQPGSQVTRVASRRFGVGGGQAADLAMLGSVSLILCRRNHEAGPGRQQVLRALVVKKAVESGEPEGSTPAALRLAEDL